MESSATRPHPTSEETTTCPVCGTGRIRRTRQVARANTVASCRQCGSWFRVPRPTPMELAEIYQKDYYDTWGIQENPEQVRRGKFATFEPLLTLLDRRLTEYRLESRRLLDVGAATGLLLECAQGNGWDPWGLDLNPYAVEQLRDRFGPDRVFAGELTECDFAAETFDAICMTDLIEHVLDVSGTLKAACDLLRPDGHLCITTPRIDSLSRRVMGRHWLHFKEEHIQYFSASSIRELLQSVGFDEVIISGQYKSLTLHYLKGQLQTFPHPWLSPLIKMLWTVSPPPLRQCPVRYRCGEMLILARRQTR